MRNEPTLAVRTISRGHKSRSGAKLSDTLRVEGGLHYLRGNSSPHFTLTMERGPKGGTPNCFGCDHDTILKYYPKFADLAALHLSDIDGVPMHGAANAWYWLAGSLPENAREQYHGGNSEQYFPLPADRLDSSRPWITTECRKPAKDEALEIFARHVRVDVRTAEDVRDAVVVSARTSAERNARDRPTIEYPPCGICGHDALDVARTVGAGLGLVSISDTCGCPCHQPLAVSEYDWQAGKRTLDVWIEEQKPRWKQEAEECITRHGLKVFGDAYVWPMPADVATPADVDKDVDADADADVYRCSGCGREESVCSLNPCEDVIADRDATL